MIGHADPDWLPGRIALGVILASALVFALSLVLIYLSILAFGSPFVSPILEALGILLAAAAAGAGAVRALALPWRFTALASLLSGIGLIVIGRFDLPWLDYDQLLSSLWLEMGSGKVLDPGPAAVVWVICGAGVFFLPLFDPVVRKSGIRPAFWKVLLVGSGLTALALLADYLFSGGYMFGLLTLIFGSVAALFMVGAGLVLALINIPAFGAWMGGLGLVLQALAALAWRLLGTPWFP